jgi:hypothetical protein
MLLINKEINFEIYRRKIIDQINFEIYRRKIVNQ